MVARGDGWCCRAAETAEPTGPRYAQERYGRCEGDEVMCLTENSE